MQQSIKQSFNYATTIVIHKADIIRYKRHSIIHNNIHHGTRAYAGHKRQLNHVYVPFHIDRKSRLGLGEAGQTAWLIKSLTEEREPLHCFSRDIIVLFGTGAYLLPGDTCMSASYWHTHTQTHTHTGGSHVRQVYIYIYKYIAGVTHCQHPQKSPLRFAAEAVVFLPCRAKVLLYQ